jgi:hypothetical protein
MFRSQSRLIGYLLPNALAVFFLLSAQVSAQKSNASGVSAPPTLTLTLDTSEVTACAGALQQVRMNAVVTCPPGTPVRYHWSTSAGRITGDGSVVTWDLSGVAPGTYKAFIDVQTGVGGSECQAFTSTRVVVKPCPPVVQPTCPNLEISCPTNIAIDQPLTFSSSVSGGTPVVVPVYNWSLSAGTIIEGQGTNSIRVDTTGLAGQTVKATLSMGGYPMDCSASCAVSIPVPQLKCRKFDEFPDISRNDEKARLDNYGIVLQNDPTATGYVVVYPGRSGKPGDAQKRAANIVDYIVNSRGLDARRIVTLVGGARDELIVELWSCPQGATAPNP